MKKLNGSRRHGFYFSILAMMLFVSLCYADGWLPGSTDQPNGDTSAAGNRILNNTLSDDGLRIGGIANTRHNLTMSYNGKGSVMNQFRNNYYEICVYCHTPHGANSTVKAPLWNRTVAQRTYTLYSQDSTSSTTPSSSDLNYSQPGPNSLTCLSCHDGATAIDSIINMPTQLNGSFRAGYSKGQETQVNASFLDQWSGNKLGTASPADSNSTTAGHMGFNAKYTNAGGTPTAPTQGECLTCHNPASTGVFNAPDFQVFSIGDRYLARDDNTLARQTNYLADDHPIGVAYPEKFGPGVDYNEPDVIQTKIAFFDRNSNQHADPNEVRLYNSGERYEVECASCHDPHGVKVTGDSNELIPSFLRVGEIRSNVAYESLAADRSFVSGNAGSALCLTCHVK